MLTGLWYDFLRSFNIEMRIARRYIALVTDNCSTHPHPQRPPQNYIGPTPPELTNITLIYLPPNTTSRLQPLDQGIIKAFKAAYRRRYAENMVQHFNFHGTVPEKIDILRAIYLIADAWNTVSNTTIINCWKKADICGVTESANSRQTAEDQFQHFIAAQRTHCQIAIQQIFKLTFNYQAQGFTETFQLAFDEFFTFDEDQINNNSEAEVPNAVKIVQDGFATGVLTRGVTGLDSHDDEEEDEFDNSTELEIGFPTLDEAIHYTTELSRYLQAIKVTELQTIGGARISVAKMVSDTGILQKGLLQYVFTVLLP